MRYRVLPATPAAARRDGARPAGIPARPDCRPAGDTRPPRVGRTRDRSCRPVDGGEARTRSEWAPLAEDQRAGPAEGGGDRRKDLGKQVVPLAELLGAAGGGLECLGAAVAECLHQGFGIGAVVPETSLAVIGGGAGG